MPERAPPVPVRGAGDPAGGGEQLLRAPRGIAALPCRRGDQHAERAVRPGPERQPYRQRPLRLGAHVPRLRGDRGQRTEGLAGGARFALVLPRLGERAHALLSDGLRPARLPQVEQHRLPRIRVGAAHLDHGGVGVRLHVDRGAHAAAAFAELAAVEVEPARVVGRFDQAPESRQHQLARRQAAWQGVRPVELQGQAALRPDGDAQAAVAQRHGLVGPQVRVFQHDVGAAHHAADVDVEVLVVPCRRWRGGFGRTERRHAEAADERQHGGQACLKRRGRPADHAGADGRGAVHGLPAGAAAQACSTGGTAPSRSASGRYFGSSTAA